MKLISSQQLADSENFRDLAHMEESDFEGALSFALKMIVDSSHGAKRVDISDFLEIEGSMQEAFFAFHGEHELLRKFLIMFKETGIDEMLQKCGCLPLYVLRTPEDANPFRQDTRRSTNDSEFPDFDPPVCTCLCRYANSNSWN